MYILYSMYSCVWSRSVVRRQRRCVDKSDQKQCTVLPAVVYNSYSTTTLIVTTAWHHCLDNISTSWEDNLTAQPTELSTACSIVSHTQEYTHTTNNTNHQVRWDNIYSTIHKLGKTSSVWCIHKLLTYVWCIHKLLTSVWYIHKLLTSVWCIHN